MFSLPPLHPQNISWSFGFLMTILAPLSPFDNFLLALFLFSPQNPFQEPSVCPCLHTPFFPLVLFVFDAGVLCMAAY